MIDHQAGQAVRPGADGRPAHGRRRRGSGLGRLSAASTRRDGAASPRAGQIRAWRQSAAIGPDGRSRGTSRRTMPTPRRLAEARRRGDVAQSRDLRAAVALAATGAVADRVGAVERGAAARLLRDGARPGGARPMALRAAGGARARHRRAGSLAVPLAVAFATPSSSVLFRPAVSGLAEPPRWPRISGGSRAGRRRAGAVFAPARARRARGRRSCRRASPG